MLGCFIYLFMNNSTKSTIDMFWRIVNKVTVKNRLQMKALMKYTCAFKFAIHHGLITVGQVL